MNLVPDSLTVFETRDRGSAVVSQNGFFKQCRCRKLLQKPTQASCSSDTMTPLLSLLILWCQDMFDMGKMSQRFSIRLYVRRPAGLQDWLDVAKRLEGVSAMLAVNAGCSSKSSTTSSPSGWVL